MLDSEVAEHHVLFGCHRKMSKPAELIFRQVFAIIIMVLIQSLKRGGYKMMYKANKWISEHKNIAIMLYNLICWTPFLLLSFTIKIHLACWIAFGIVIFFVSDRKSVV